MIDDSTLKTLVELAADPKTPYVSVPSQTLLELVRAYEHHKRVLPLHQAIAEACKKLGY